MKAAILLTILLPLASQGQLLAGGSTDIALDGTDPNVQFAVSAINDFHTKLGDSEPRTLVEVVSAQSQVVAGTLYHLLLRLNTSSGMEELCKVDVWSRPWLTGDEALQMSKDPACKMSTMTKLATTMKPMLAGGIQSADVSDKDVQNALMFAAQSLNSMENSLYIRKPVKVEEVKSQVVSGMAYHFRGVHMAATTCTKTSAISLSNDMSLCAVKDPADVRVCDFDIWWQSWMTPEYKLSQWQCK